MSGSVQCQCGVVLHVAAGASNFRCPKCREWIMRKGEYAGALSLGSYAYPGQTKPQPKTPQLHWKRLHRYAFSVHQWSSLDAANWLREWTSEIPGVGCDCRKEWGELTSQCPPDLSSREAFFAWTVEAHNQVNRRLGKPVLSLDEARLLHDMHYALTQTESIAAPRSPLAVVSIASGSHLSTLEQTRPLRAQYAARIGADLVELTDDRWHDFPMANKWRLASVLAAGYERVLYVDSDVVIKPDAPNIFDVVPAGSVGVVNELPTIRSNGPVQANYPVELAAVASEYGCDTPRWCPNGGVIVLPREFAHVYSPPRVVRGHKWCIDQYLLAVNCELTQAPVTLLGDEWNWCWIDRRFWAGISGAHFLHANGTGSGAYREQVIDSLIAGDDRMLTPPPGIWQPNWYSHLPDERVSIGFASMQYIEIGGTETWHATLVPPLSERFRCEGMSVSRTARGDASRFGCRVEYGEDAARRLAERVDVLIAWGQHGLCSILGESKRPKVIHIHHGDENSDWSDSECDRHYQVVDCFVAVNEKVADRLRARFPDRRVEYVPNAVDPSRVIPSKALPRFDRHTVVWCARMEPDKRVELAIAAAEAMPDWQFVVIGDGTQRPKTVPPNVLLTGILPSQADYLAIADVFLQTAPMEGFGLSMGEAMLAGVPVVATPFGLGQHAEVVRQVPADPTAAEMAAAIRLACGDRQLASRAKAFITEHHGVERCVSRWEQVIHAVARGEPQ